MSTTVRRKKRLQSGSGILDTVRRIVSGAKKVHDFVKGNRLVSKSARVLGFESFANRAKQAGYGRRRRPVIRRVRRIRR